MLATMLSCLQPCYHACNHVIMPANKYLIRVHSMNDINLWYNVCMLKSYKNLSIMDMRSLLLLITVYLVCVMNQCRRLVRDTYCTTIVSVWMLHMSLIYNTCCRMLMFVNCDLDHHDCSSWHFWHIVHDSSTLSIMVQYLWGYIYSLSMIWRYYMNVMFIFLLYNQDLRECYCKSRSILYGHHHHIDCILYADHYRLY